LHWKDVTPPGQVAFAKVAIIDAGHFDAQTAYAAINTLRLDDLRPHILRTHDGGKTWTEIVNGMAGDAPVDAVREDPKHKGLLFAGTEREVYVSFDDGDHWQSLRLNMPPSSVRDIIIKDDDLIAATHGRGFWILDDITPLRQMTPGIANAAAFLFRPQTAVRVRWDMNTDTPVPPDEPAGQNPPDGAIIDYYLGPAASGPVTLEISDSAGKLVRRYSSDDPAPRADPALAIPSYWVRPAQTLSNHAGMHRFLWDMHYAPLPEERPEYPMQAIAHDTPVAASSPWAMTGTYTVKLTVNGQSYAEPLAVKMDPRVHTSSADLLLQFSVSKQLYDDQGAAAKALEQIRALREKLRALRERAAPGAASDAVTEFDQKLAALQGTGGGGRGGRGAASGPDTITSVNGSLSLLMRMIQGADAAPTSQAMAAAADRRKAMAGLLQRWTAMKAEGLATLNRQLKLGGLSEITIE
jgi:hypothetical protein